ncbi:hypothetical protein HN997_05205, partial [archaeon]|nr:hypothetical protein [archaeon]
IEPDKILEKFKEQKVNEEEAIKKLIPELSKIQGLSDKKAKIEIFEGKEGMKTVMSRILKDNPQEFFVYGSSGVGYKLLPFYLEHWHKQRIKQKMKMKVIYNQSAESKERVEEGPSLKLSEIKFFPAPHHSPSGTIIYGDKVLITLWNLEFPLAISIESKEITENYKDYFEVIWRVAKK